MDATVADDAARRAVHAELAALLRRRRLAFTAIALGIWTLAAGAGLLRAELRGPAIALAAAVTFGAGAALGVPSRRASVPMGALALVAAAASVALGSTPTPEGAGVGFFCLGLGAVAGVALAALITVALAPLLLRSTDARWPVAASAGALALGALAVLCPHHHALHLWASHLPVVPLVYVMARLAFGRA